MYLKLRGARVCIFHTGPVPVLFAVGQGHGHTCRVSVAGFPRFGFGRRWRCRFFFPGLGGAFGIAPRRGLSLGLRGGTLLGLGGLRGFGLGLGGGPFGYRFLGPVVGVGFVQPFTPADPRRGWLFGFRVVDALLVVDRVLLGRPGGRFVPWALDARGVCARCGFAARPLFSRGARPRARFFW